MGKYVLKRMYKTQIKLYNTIDDIISLSQGTKTTGLVLVSCEINVRKLKTSTKGAKIIQAKSYKHKPC